MKRKRLLFLCHTVPYPPFQGVEIRALNILRLLSREYEIDLLCFHRFKSADGLAAASAALRPFADVSTFSVRQFESRRRLVWDHLRSIVLRRVYTEFMYESHEFREALIAAVHNRGYSVVHIDSVADLAGYLPTLEGLPVVGTHHNVESELLQRRALIEGGWLRRMYMRIQAKLMRTSEASWCRRVQLNVAVSEPDRERFAKIAPAARFVVASNGVDTDYFMPQGFEGEGLVFVGGTTWFPNRDALEYFAREILPLIRAEYGDLRVRWVGKANDEDCSTFMTVHGIELTGLVEDIRPYVHAAACYVVPLRVGGGTRLKILDAWAMGMAVVSTSVGCEGLDAEDGRNILRGDTPSAFAAAVVSVLRDVDLRNRLGAGGRATVERTYSWERIGERLVPLYNDLIGDTAAHMADEKAARA